MDPCVSQSNPADHHHVPVRFRFFFLNRRLVSIKPHPRALGDVELRVCLLFDVGLLLLHHLLGTLVFDDVCTLDGAVSFLPKQGLADVLRGVRTVYCGHLDHLWPVLWVLAKVIDLELSFPALLASPFLRMERGNVELAGLNCSKRLIEVVLLSLVRC